MGSKMAGISSIATNVVHDKARIRRPPIFFTALIRHDALGVVSRLPSMMKAWANALLGVLKEIVFPDRENNSWHSARSWTQAPLRSDSKARAGVIAKPRQKQRQEQRQK
ncbi:MAG: hypothetical protein JO216_11575 [Hyphomicrobiales bacterium]|nr:hypothetical protein [Hyphomicrobiales bacterium]